MTLPVQARGEAPYISVSSVTKRYGATTVLHDVSLDLVRGKCVSLTGENGAGKSSLVKIISGVTQPTSGSILVDGVSVRFTSPRDAQAAGVALISQELAYCADLTVAENLLLGRWPRKVAFTSPRKIRAAAAEILEHLDLALDPGKQMADLSLGQRQLVEIAKALSADARVVILDEPTSSLNTVEADRLLDTLSSMKRRGVALIYISHRLDECFRLSDEIVVLRNGHVAARRDPRTASADEIVADMLGREYAEPHLAEVSRRSDSAPLLKAGDWRTKQIPRLRGLSFEAYRGEVTGIFGLVGSGVEVIARALGGDPRVRVHGSLQISGQQTRIFRDPSAARRAGVAYVPAERKSEGLALGRPVCEALTVLVPEAISTAGVLAHRAERRLAREVIARFDIRCQSPKQPVGELSGGNQQKALLAGRLLASPTLLVLHEPTRGVDVGARGQIHECIVESARNGAAVVVVTSDLAEATAVSDVVYVVRNGLIVAELRSGAKTENAALAAAATTPDSAC